MSEHEHIIERRVVALADAIRARRQLITNALLPSNQRPLFTKQLSKKDAMAFWQQHRFDDVGKQVSANMKPEDVMELDLALSQANEPTEGVDNGIY
mgnify:CR=1